MLSDFGIEEIPDKIWAHRINNFDSNTLILDEFKGIEVDVFYNTDNNMFSVKHDIEDDGINLELFLDSVLNYKKVPIWIDYKNMNDSAEQGIKKMHQILNKYNLLNSSFVESYNLNALKKVNGKFMTSFWYGVKHVPVSRAGQDSLYLSKYKHLDLSEFTMLSSPHHMFEFFSYYFPKVKCNYWMSGALNADSKERLAKIAKTENTNVILIDGRINYLK